jgi:ABC-2 type transport system permease protein
VADLTASTAPPRAGTGTAEPLAVLRGVLREGRRSLVLWAVALASVTTIYVSFYPAMGGDEMAAMIESLPEDLSAALGYDRMGSAGGYLTSTVYGLLGPILVLVFAIGRGARTIAGEEEDGSLELELTAPVSRTTVLLQRLAALWLSLVALVAVVVAVTVVLVGPFGFEGVTVGDVVGAGLGMLLLGAAFGTVAVAAGAVTGRRPIALAAAAGLAVASYVANALSGLAEGAAWLEDVSPFGWYLGQDPVVDGPSWTGYLLLAALILVAAAVATTVFRRRDLMV